MKMNDQLIAEEIVVTAISMIIIFGAIFIHLILLMVLFPLGVWYGTLFAQFFLWNHPEFVLENFGNPEKIRGIETRLNWNKMEFLHGE